MPKRFTATEMWMDPWFRELPVEYKAFWMFICAQCDNAGVWKVDMQLASYLLKADINETKAASLFGTRLTILEKGNWLINQFVEFQFGRLSQASKPHIQVLGLIEKHRVSKGYPKGIHTLKDKEKDKEKDKGVAGGGGLRFSQPTAKEVSDYAKSIGFVLDGAQFVDYYATRGWKIGHTPIKDWRACVRTWKTKSNEKKVLQTSGLDFS